jgi:multidrug efflux pump subunit AcrA (membrane-fusion protein)
LKEGDIVLGMVNQNVGDADTPENSSLHGTWVKWSSVKAQLLAEARGELSQSGTWGTGSVTGVSTETLLDRVTNVLTSLGISIKDGVTSIAKLATQSFSADTATVKGLQMVDKATGDIYCTWIENGEWEKVKGECGSVAVAAAATATTTQAQADQTNQQMQQVIQQTQQVIQQVQQVVQNSQQTTQQAAQQAQQAAQAAQQTTQQAQQTTQQAQSAANTAETAAAAAQQAASQAAQAVEQIQSQPQAVSITSVAAIADINVAYGTGLSSLNLPTTVNVTLSDSTNQTVSVTWDSGAPTYDPNTSGTYTFSGTLTFSGNITNTNNLTATVNVIVAVNPNPAAPVGELIQDAASSLLNGVWNFVKSMFVSVAKAASLLTAGLFEPILKLFGR